MSKLFKKSGAAAPGITATDWLQLKPYSAAGAYDRDYIKLCQQVFEILNNHQEIFKELKLTRDHRKGLACVLVSQFEDFINEIGIWQAFTNYHRELYNEWLPFGAVYDMSEYEADYYNPQDVLLLTWYYVCTLSGQRMVAPDAPYLVDIANEVYELLEAQIEEVPATDFYDNFLQIPPGKDFFELKELLRWFALKSYVLQPFTNPLLQESILELAEKSDNPDHIGKFSYAAIEKYLYYWYSPYLALSAPEWLARVARGTTDTVRQELAGLQRKAEGMFLIEKMDERYYYMKVQLTNQVFPVLKDSFSSKERMLGDDMLYFMGIKKWNAEWHMSGSTMGLPNVPEVIRAQRQQPPSFYLMSRDQQQIAHDSTEEMRQAFVAYFGSEYAIFDTGKAMKQSVNAFHRDYQRKIAAQTKTDTQGISDFDYVGADIPMKESAAAYFNTGLGIEYYFDVKNIAQWLESPEPLTSEQSREVWDFLTDEDVSLAFTHFMLNKHYKGVKLNIFPSSDIDYMQHLDFFMRYFKPEEFGEQIPRTIIIDNLETLR